MEQEELFKVIFDKDDITWKSLLYELVRSEDMDPWDINVSDLSQKFLDMVRQLKQMDFRISGKVVLASAILLKIKSKRLLGADLENLDRMFAQNDEEEEGLLDELEQEKIQQKEEHPNRPLIPKTPQARKRKVSIFDLVNALEKAMEVKKRRVMRDMPAVDVTIPEKKIDISQTIKDVYGRIRSYFIKNTGSKLTFSKLIPSETREGKVYTFIPLLHLRNQRKIDLHQFEHFGDIEVEMLRRSNKESIDKELRKSSS
ncbi:hypothetical protein GF336_01255 [Candidatus Woesearchaeota archaeon]|nr:hypothetical protein [Candidatus Woesearchaeota archaeon]